MAQTLCIYIIYLAITIILGCPDLTLDGRRMQSSHYIDTRNIPPHSCAINECNTGVGRRQLLKFDGAIPNIGTSDLDFGAPTSGTGFVWDACHRHYHFNHFMDYQVFLYDNYSNPEPILEGDKRAFCLRDDTQVSSRLLREYGVTPASSRRRYDCDDQGIQLGWQDVYGRELECQWIDITDLARGRYKMRAEVNPLVGGRRRIDECGKYGNNVVWMEFEKTQGRTTSTTQRPRDNGNNNNNNNNNNIRNPTYRPTNRPTERPRSSSGSRRDTSRFGSSLFDRFFGNDDQDCTPEGRPCRLSSECCGISYCYRTGRGFDRECR